MKIAHLADIHIRFSSRHDEYRVVFERLFKDLKSQKPARIVIVGDLNHQKINMSPGSLDLSVELLINLAKIAPVDIFMGNHDMNMSQREQGDTITPIINIANKFYDLNTSPSKKDDRKAFIVSSENKDKINFSKKGIYFFPDSGFYNISDKIVYGVYSCKDNEILTLEKRDDDKQYIAFYHGQIKGARGNNGYELKGENLLNIDTFKNFDMVMLGDIHEHQSFEMERIIMIDECDLEKYKKEGWNT